MLGLKRLTNILKARAAVDPDLQIRGVGGGVLKIFFCQPFGPQLGPKIKGKPGPRARHLNPPLKSTFRIPIVE